MLYVIPPQHDDEESIAIKPYEDLIAVYRQDQYGDHRELIGNFSFAVWRSFAEWLLSWITLEE